MQPILVTKAFFNTAGADAADLLNISFNKERTVEKKFLVDQYYLTLKQKRYKRKKNIPLRSRVQKTYDGKSLSQIKKYADHPYLSASRILHAAYHDTTKLYRAMRKNKIRHEHISVQFARRLLRTKKTLVLPAHLNLTIISNSYDVVHS